MVRKHELERKAHAEGIEKAIAERAAPWQARRQVEEEKRNGSLLAADGRGRLIQQGLARGWTAWRDEYREYQRKRRNGRLQADVKRS